MIALVVAYSHGRVIGKSQDIPWHMPADLKHFKQLTIHKTVVMGRTTADSILNRLGHGLSDRLNIVVTRDESYAPDGMSVAHTLNEALSTDTNSEIMIIGGAQIYAQTIEQADRLYVTQIDAEIEGDTLFPLINLDEWQETNRESHPKDEHNPYNYDFVIFDRIS
ncbi:MAG: dihydrofolate reductase [Candidatus Saccharimonadales bacterium]